jgi:hypothetical protein
MNQQLHKVAAAGTLMLSALLSSGCKERVPAENTPDFYKLHGIVNDGKTANEIALINDRNSNQPKLRFPPEIGVSVYTPDTHNPNPKIIRNALAFFNQMGDAQRYGMALSTDDLVSLSKTDFTALAALNAASVFRFTGTTASERLQNSNYDLYTKWQQDLLDTKADEYGTRNFSDKWRADRAKLIEALREGSDTHSDNSNQLFIEDKTLQRGFLLSPGGFFDDPSGANFTVLGTDQILFGSDAIDDTFAGAAGDDHLYGGDGSDMLDGGAGDDYVEGNAGNNSLLDGAGKDILLGGIDTYRFTSGDGNDTLIDGQGRIIWGGNAFAFRLSDRIWLAKLVSTKLPETWWRMPVRVLLFMALRPLPVVDGIIGKIQLDRLAA